MLGSIRSSGTIGKSNGAVALFKANGTPILTGENYVDSADFTGQEGMTFQCKFLGIDKVYNLGADCIGRAMLDNGITTLDNLELAEHFTPSKKMFDKLKAGFDRQVLRHAEREASRKVTPEVEAAKLEAPEVKKTSKKK